MTQSRELAKVKARIRALTEKTISNGCTEAEAVAAAEMVGRLLRQYALSMDEVALRQAQCVQRSIPLGGVRRRPIDGCVPSIARFCECKVWIAREEAAASYVFFGLEDDVVLALYLFDVIRRGMAAEVDRFKAAPGALAGQTLRQAAGAYQSGMAARIAERLETMRDERAADIRAASPASGTLVVFKEAIVEEAFKESRIRLVTSRPRTVRADAAYRRGYAAGDRVNLNRPLRAEGKGQLG